MKFKMFSIFDAAAAAFLPPWTVPTEAMALRYLSDLPAAQPAHDFVRHSDQYTLFCLAEFDSANGLLSETTPVAVANLKVLFARVKVAPNGAMEEPLERIARDAGHLAAFVEGRDHE